MKHIKQKHKTSCGPACVAMVAGVSHKKAVIAMFGEHKKKKLRSDWKQIRRAFKKLGVEYAEKPRRTTHWDNITETAIVGCDKKGNKWHWVVYVPEEKQLYDPEEKKAYPLKEFSRKPFKYLVVTARLHEQDEQAL